ncbi:MAG: radical SAM protein, partial [Patescibacteria group bacterium]
VDKIVFGKWNYNSFVSNFEEYREFYDETAQKVIEFCEKRNIGVHIKDGTMLNSNKKQLVPSYFIRIPKQESLFVG